MTATDDLHTWVLSPAELKAVFSKAECGSVIVYAVGDLNYTRFAARGNLGADAERTGRYAYSLYEDGEAELTQNRLGPNKYEYRITRR